MPEGNHLLPSALLVGMGGGTVKLEWASGVSAKAHLEGDEVDLGEEVKELRADAVSTGDLTSAVEPSWLRRIWLFFGPRC